MARIDPPPYLPILPLEQSPAYAAALRCLGAGVEEMALDGGRATVLRRRILPGLVVRLASRGPVWCDGMATAGKATALRTLARRGPCLVTPEDAGDAAALRLAGFRQVMTPAHLACLALPPDPDDLRGRLAGSWRSALRQAERGSVQWSIQPFKPGRDGWLLDREAAQRRGKGYRALPPALVPALADHAPRDVWTLTARRTPGGDPTAAMILIRHGRVATYHIGWSGPEGRQDNAMHLLLWQAMLWCVAKGIVRLDLGTVDVRGAPGLLRFKLGTGAGVHALGGTWARLIPPWR